MAFIVKNTFLDLEEERVQDERRSSSIPRSWKPPMNFLCNRDSSAYLSNASTTHSDRSYHSESGDSHEHICCMSQDGYDSPQNSPRWQDYRNLPWLQDSLQVPPPPTNFAAHPPSLPMTWADATDHCQQEANPEQQLCRMRIVGATLERMEGEALGLELEIVDDGTFLVTGIVHDSVAFKWNRKHRTQKKQIRIGDHIFQVNGIQGNSQQMMQALQAPVVMLKVRQAVSEPYRESKARCKDKRTALNAHAPLFQPGQASQNLSQSPQHVVSMVQAEADVPPVHTRPEVMAVLSAVESSLMCCNHVGRMQKKVAKDHLSVRFAADLQHSSLASDVLSFAKECLLNAASESKNVYLLGSGTDPFKDIKEGGFSAKLSYVPPEQVGQACWDAYHQGCCPRRKTCVWNHPSKADVLEIKVVVKCSARN